MAQKKKAIIVICPGGAYQWLSPRESEPIARAFEAMGYETSILRYTVQAEDDPAPLGRPPTARRYSSAAFRRAATWPRRWVCTGRPWGSVAPTG